MFKIRKIKPEDRGCIYKILQRNDDMNTSEINLEMIRIDSILFEGEISGLDCLILETDQEPLAGYCIYGSDPSSVGTFQIQNLYIMPMFRDLPAMKHIVSFLEAQVRTRNGQLLLTEFPSDENHLFLKRFFRSQKYRARSRIKDYYAQGIDKLIYGKTLN